MAAVSANKLELLQIADAVAREKAIDRGIVIAAMEEALHDVPLYREFAKLDGATARLPDETTILNFRHLLEANDLADDIFKAVNTHLARKGLLLKKGSIVDATIIAAPSSTKNAEGERDAEMHQTKKGNQWYFGMKAHIGVDADSGLVHEIRVVTHLLLRRQAIRQLRSDQQRRRDHGHHHRG